MGIPSRVLRTVRCRLIAYLETMRIRLGTLRRYLREVMLSEVGANGGFPGQPVGRNVLSPDINAREQLGAISAKAMDTVSDPDGLPDHLREPQESPEDCFGPVPPTAEDPGVYQDPLVRDSSPLPTSNIRRG
jgi:hypothetical protein